jgi:alpha-glucosidase (family GH31 glycosyl hydrolase)
MMGESILPAAVSTANNYDPNENTTVSNVPPGVWFNYNATTTVVGPQTLTYHDVPLDVMVVFIRAGSILTLARDEVQYSDALGGALEVHVYAGADCAFTLFEDDGATLDYVNSPATAVRETTWSWTETSRQLKWAVTGTYTGPNSFNTVKAVLFVANASSPIIQNANIGNGGSMQF